MKTKSLNPRNPIICVILVLTFLSACSRTYHEQSYEYPAWTPDGKIVYWYADYYINRADLLGSLQGTSGGTSLHIMDADGNNDKKLFDAPSYGTFHLSVSADGTKILNGGQILDLATGQELAKNEDVYPGDWSPDGKKIVFVKGTIKIWDVSSNVVTDTGLDGRNPNWKYNENFIFEYQDVSKNWVTIQMNYNGKEIKRFFSTDLPQYENSGIYCWDLGEERHRIKIDSNEILATYNVQSDANGKDAKLSPSSNKLIWNTTETPTRKSIWIENIDGTGKLCLKESK